MISSELSYHQAEAILEQMAATEFWEAQFAGWPAQVQARAVPAPRAPSLVRRTVRRAWSGETFRSFVHAAPDALVVFDPEGTIVLVNPPAERLFSYRADELPGQPFELLVPEYVRGLRAENADSILSRRGIPRESVSLELEGRRKDGRSVPLEVSFSPLEDGGGPLITGTIRDVSSRRRLEARYQHLVEGIPAVTFLAALDEGNSELYVSPQIEQLLGFSQKEWLEDPVLWYSQLHAEDRERWHVEFSQTCSRGAPFRSVYRFVARDGRVVWVQGEAKLVRDAAGRPLFLQGVAFDITERKNAEEALRRSHDELEDVVEQRTSELARANRQLQAALKEKESLLKEIHHRVKNNLQVISSLLNLQSASIRDPATLHAIRESQNRVRSMALVHEKLYRSHDLSRIPFRQYIRELTASLVHSYGGRASQIVLRIGVDDETLSIDAAIPCGLIVTELVSNSLKYAFPEQRTGEIFISLHSDAGLWTLAVGDNGIGLPKDLDPRRTESLGLQLVSTLANQLRAEVDVTSNAGTRFVFRFREPPSQ